MVILHDVRHGAFLFPLFPNDNPWHDVLFLAKDEELGRKRKSII